MHDHRTDRGWHRDLLHPWMVDADREHQAAVQRRRNVVHVHGTAGDRLALHRVLQQLQLRARLREQRIGGHHRRDRRRR